MLKAAVEDELTTAGLALQAGVAGRVVVLVAIVLDGAHASSYVQSTMEENPTSDQLRMVLGQMGKAAGEWADIHDSLR
jgi:uncharacterized protein YneF (UPF0154 family)